MAVPAAGDERAAQVLTGGDSRERLARWLFTHNSSLATVGGLHWEHLGTSARMVWLDRADDAITLLRDQ